MHTVLAAALVVTLNGTPAPDAEICGFRALSSATPFQQFLGSNEIVCSASFPPGLWNVYAHRGKTHVSAHTFLIDSRKPLPGLELRLEPAATVTFGQVPAGWHGVAYLTDTLSAFAATENGTALIPADRDLVPIVAKDGALLSVGEPFRASAGTSETVIIAADMRAIATWVSIAPADVEALRTAKRRQPPQIVTTSGKSTIRAANPIRGTAQLNGAMQFFRNLPAGAAVVEVSGAPWKRVFAPVTVPAAGVVVTPSPLPLVPTSAIALKWAARRDLVDLSAKGAGGCPNAKGQKKVEAKPIVSILSCPGRIDATNLPFLDRDHCSVAGKHDWTADSRSGGFVFDDLQPGPYVVEFAFGDLPPLRQSVRLERFEQEVLPVDVDYSTLYGRVTAGGRPLTTPAKISFGFSYGTVTDEEGNYTAVLSEPLRTNRVVSVRSCDGTRVGEHIVDRDVLPNSRYDIDLPANRIVVQAVDADTNAPVAGAIVRFGAFRGEEMSSVFYFRVAMSEVEGKNVLQRTDLEGRYIVPHLPPEKNLRVCVEHEDYERACSDTLQLTSTEEKTLRITMKPKKGFAGRITNVNDVSGGQLYWFAVDGLETERTDVKQDGSFRFNRPHDPAETVAFVSINHPLFVFPQPQFAQGDPMLVAIPLAVPRTFSVLIGENNPQQDALVTVAIGGIVVPYPAFAQHCALHGSQLQLMNRGPFVVPDILETAPISAILGPPPEQVTPEMRRIDLFRLPQFRSSPRKMLGADGRVVF